MAGSIDFSFDGDKNGNSVSEKANGSISGNSGSYSTSEGTNGQARNPADYSGPVAKKRGRKPLPRDAAGNIIRDGESGTEARAQKQSKLDLGKFVPNNRPALRQQIQGIHAAAATITKQPVFLLSDLEANALSNSLCDVLDYHEFNLTEAGGAGGLYLALALTVFGIYKPRLDSIRRGGAPTIEGRSTSPASAGEARSEPKGMMDFTADFNPSDTGQSLN